MSAYHRVALQHVSETPLYQFSTLFYQPLAAAASGAPAIGVVNLLLGGFLLPVPPASAGPNCRGNFGGSVEFLGSGNLLARADGRDEYCLARLGLGYFARAMVLALPDMLSGSGAAVGWLIQPTTGGRRVLRSLNSMLHDPREQSEFFNAMKCFLLKIQAADLPPHSLLRNLSGCTFAAYTQIEDLLVLM